MSDGNRELGTTGSYGRHARRYLRCCHCFRDFAQLSGQTRYPKFCSDGCRVAAWRACRSAAEIVTPAASAGGVTNSAADRVVPSLPVNPRTKDTRGSRGCVTNSAADRVVPSLPVNPRTKDTRGSRGCRHGGGCQKATVVTPRSVFPSANFQRARSPRSQSPNARFGGHASVNNSNRR